MTDPVKFEIIAVANLKGVQDFENAIKKAANSAGKTQGTGLNASEVLKVQFGLNAVTKALNVARIAAAGTSKAVGGIPGALGASAAAAQRTAAAFSTLKGAQSGLGAAAAPIEKNTTRMDRFRKTIEGAARALNTLLGGKLKNVEGLTNSLSQNISSIGNRLGFMAFQWKFMGNAAQAALQGIVGNLQHIIMEGSQVQDALTRALAFTMSDPKDLLGMTEHASDVLTSMQKKIRSLGSGQTMFGIPDVSQLAETLNQAMDATSTENVLAIAVDIKTIMPSISNDKLATGLTSYFAALGIDAADSSAKGIAKVTAAVDVLVAGMNKSPATFESVIGSLAGTAQSAKLAGINLLELGAIEEIVSRDLGRNRSTGRGASVPGTYASAFVQDIAAAASAKTKIGKMFREKKINIFTNNGKDFKDLVGIADEFRSKLDGLSETQKAAFISEIGFSKLGKDTVLELIKHDSKALIKLQKDFLKGGALQALKLQIETSPLVAIQKIQASISSLKGLIAQAFNPALQEMAKIMKDIANDPEIIKFMLEFGHALGENVMPVVRTVAKIVKGFLQILSRNKGIIKLVTLAVVALGVALGGLTILTTIGYFALAAGGSLFALTGQIGLAAGAVGLFNKALRLTLLRLIPFALVMIGVGLVVLSLTGLFETKLAVAIGAVGAVLATLSIAFLAWPNKIIGVFTGLLSKIAALQIVSKITAPFTSALSSIVTAFGGAPKNILSGGFITGLEDTGTKGSTGFLSKFGSIGKGLSKIFGGLTSGLPVIAAVTAAVIIATAFAVWLDNTVKDSPIFQGKLAGYWETAGWELKAATGKTLHAIADGFMEFGKFIIDLFKNVWGYATDLWVALTTGDWDKALKLITQAVTVDPFAFLISSLDTTQVVIDGVALAFSGLKKQIASGKLDPLMDTPEEILGVIQHIKDQTGTSLSIDEIKKIVNDYMGAQVFPEQQIASHPIGPQEQKDILPPSFGDFDFAIAGFTGQLITNMAQLATNNQNVIDQTAIMLKNIDASKITEEGTSAFNTAMGTQTASLDKITVETDLSTTEVNKNTKTEKTNTNATKVNSEKTNESSIVTDENSYNTIADSEVIIKRIEMMKLQIIEIARNTNILSSMTVFMSQVNVMWANLIAQGNRAAGKLSSLKVSASGKFSISDPGVSKADQKLIDNAEKILSSTISNQLVIGIDELKAELIKISVILNQTKDAITTIDAAGNTIGLPADVIPGDIGSTGSGVVNPNTGGVVIAQLPIEQDPNSLPHIIGEPWTPPNISGSLNSGFTGSPHFLGDEGGSQGTYGKDNPDPQVAKYTYKTPDNKLLFKKSDRHPDSGFGTALMERLANGDARIDINVDGTYDITAINGVLTRDQMELLKGQISSELAKAVENAIKVNLLK